MGFIQFLYNCLPTQNDTIYKVQNEDKKKKVTNFDEFKRSMIMPNHSSFYHFHVNQ